MKLDALSEKDLVAALLTKDHGVVRAAVKGARGRTKRAAALQILTEVEATYFRREGADLARLQDVEIVASSFELATRSETAMLLPYIAESALTFVPESEPGGDVYRLVRHVLDALAAGTEAALAARYFEVWLLFFAGLLPEAKECALCGEPLGTDAARLQPEIPGFTHAACAPPGSLPVSEAMLRLLASFRHARLTALPPAERRSLDDLEGLTREVRRRFLGHELKSYRFLRSLG